MTTVLDAPTRPHVATKPQAAIYTRVSTLDQQGGASLTTQKADCARYAEASGMIVTHEYLDVQSGLKSDRAQYQAMLRAAQAGEFQRIIVWKMDRFGRDRIESGYQLRALQQIGVRVDSATEPNDSPLLRNILMDFAEEESRRISQRVSANQKTRAQSGKRTSVPPFGYSNVPYPDGGVTLEPNQDASIVTEAFQMYASGRHSLADVRAYVASASSTPNRPQTRQGIHHLLKNPVYIGQIRHGLFAKSKVDVKSKAEKLAEVFQSEGCHEALIDQQTFNKVQARLANNRTQATGRPHAAFMFTGLVWCTCGARYSAYQRSKNGSVSYHCTRKVNSARCESSSIAESRLKEAVLPPVQALLAHLSKADMRKAVREALASQIAKAAPDSKVGQREKLEARLSKLEDSYLDGDITRDRYISKRDEIMAELASLKPVQPQAPAPDLDSLFALADALEGEPPDNQEWREIIEGMVDRVIIQGHDIRVVWKDAFEPLFGMTAEG